MATRDSRDSRQRAVDATLLLLRTQGLAATGLSRIVRDSKAPRGSIYHHFPGGKQQLVVEALRTAGAAVAAKIGAALAGHPYAAVALRHYAEDYAEDIRRSNFERGCPVGNAAMDAAATSKTIRTVCGEIFAGWEELIAERLRHEGVAGNEADALAELVLSALEGAVILCRARRSTKPLERVADRMGALIDSAPRPSDPPATRVRRAKTRREPRRSGI